LDLRKKRLMGKVKWRAMYMNLIKLKKRIFKASCKWQG